MEQIQEIEGCWQCFMQDRLCPVCFLPLQDRSFEMVLSIKVVFFFLSDNEIVVVVTGQMYL